MIKISTYKSMYNKLFNKITDVIYELQEIQQLTEEMYISSDEPTIIIIGKNNSNEKTESWKCLCLLSYNASMSSSVTCSTEYCWRNPILELS